MFANRIVIWLLSVAIRVTTQRQNVHFFTRFRRLLDNRGGMQPVVFWAPTLPLLLGIARVILQNRRAASKYQRYYVLISLGRSLQTMPSELNSRS